MDKSPRDQQKWRVSMAKKSNITTKPQQQGNAGKAPARDAGEPLEVAVARLAAYIRRHTIPIRARSART
jgi:hypothetical protein